MAPKKPAKKPALKAATKPVAKAAAAPMEQSCCSTDGSCGTGCGCGCGPKLFGCHIAGLFTKSCTWLAAIVAFVVLWGFDFLWHGKLMMDTYLATATLWRPEAEMQALWQYCILYHGILALVFTVSFSLMGSGTCFIKGIKNGALIMAPLAASTLMVYISQTIPADILKMWALGYLAQGAVTGFALALAINLGSKKSCCSQNGCGM